MKIKTTGQCLGCGDKYLPVKGGAHLLQCPRMQESLHKAPVLVEGYFLRISWKEQPNMYWMFVAMPGNLPLEKLDVFLRDVWLDCCGHLSEFIIEGEHYMSYPELGSSQQSMRKPVNQIFSPGLKFQYTYDMGSETNLVLHVVKDLSACPQKKVTMLMQNEPPVLPCEACSKRAQIICTLCGKTTCPGCSKRHDCALQEEGDTYMLMSFANSPPAGVCGYGGRYSNAIIQPALRSIEI